MRTTARSDSLAMRSIQAFSSGLVPGFSLDPPGWGSGLGGAGLSSEGVPGFSLDPPGGGSGLGSDGLSSEGVPGPPLNQGPKKPNAPARPADSTLKKTRGSTICLKVLGKIRFTCDWGAVWSSGRTLIWSASLLVPDDCGDVLGDTTEALCLLRG